MTAGYYRRCSLRFQIGSVKSPVTGPMTQEHVIQSVLDREAVATIPPRRNAVSSESVDPPDWLAMREATLREIQKPGRYE